MSSQINDTQIPAPGQEVTWNEEDWQGMLKRLPEDWEEQADLGSKRGNGFANWPVWQICCERC